MGYRDDQEDREMDVRRDVRRDADTDRNLLRTRVNNMLKYQRTIGTDRTEIAAIFERELRDAGFQARVIA